MPLLQARQVLAKNRRDALSIAEKVGNERVREQLRQAELDLMMRLQSRIPGDQTFTAEQLRTTLLQVRHVLQQLTPGLRTAVVDTGLEAADSAAGGVLEYLQRADKQYRGIGVQPLAIDEAAMLDSARSGARASLLRRLASSGETVVGADEVPHMAKLGILDRYGMNVIGHFENEMRVGLLARKPWDEMKAALISKSSFLQQAPASWAERIVRTEVMGAYNRAGWEANREADEQLGDMVKILSATFDNRTAADSYAVHGQIRRPDEAFDTWFGAMQHPPSRPNDREVVVPHRVSWPIPKYLVPRGRGEVVARWRKEGRKGAPPPTPEDTTVPRGQFGQTPAPRIEGGREGVVEPEE